MKFTHRKPHGFFDGKNFITPEVLGYYRLAKGYAELSKGKGINGQFIYGVTVQPDEDRTKSKLFQLQSAALAYIRELSP